MNLARQTRTIGIRLEDFLTELGIAIVVSLIRGILRKVFRQLTVPFSYPWTLLQVKVLRTLNWRFLTFTIPYASLQESRLSPLVPITRFYLRGVQLIIWTRFSPSIGTSLDQVFQHNHSREDKALTIATRSAQALARMFSSPETEQSWVDFYTISQMFHVASTIIVHPTQAITKLISTNRTGTQLSGRSWFLSVALKLVMMTKKLSSLRTSI